MNDQIISLRSNLNPNRITGSPGAKSSNNLHIGILLFLCALFTATTGFSLPQDYFLGDLNGSAACTTPFGNDRERDSNIGFDYISMPPVVSPGQQVPVELQWSFAGPSNATALIYMNALGDWQPDLELVRLINGELVGGSRTVQTNFTFTAPTMPGTHRIRIPFVEASTTVTNFYGGPNAGSLAPGVGSFAEVSFVVKPSSTTDYFLANLTGSAGFISPFGNDRERDANIGFDYISLPPVVTPGQQVPVELQWNFLDPLNPGAQIYMNAFGDWQPGAELARLINGESAGTTRTVQTNFAFTAPMTPGTYRIRIPFVEAFTTVTNFYGGPNAGSFAPGVGAFAEISFTVKAPPVTDYFLANLSGTAGYMTPFGNDRERDSNIGFDYISLPPVVAPGQQVPVELQWNFLDPLNSGAAIRMNAFGDWQPDVELAFLSNGSAGVSRTVQTNFAFTAPMTPGTYRIRIPFVEAFATVTNFYGGPNAGSFAPGVGAFAEVQFQVANPSKLNIQMFTGLVLSGPPGNYVIEATTNLNPAVWIPMTNITLNTASSQWVDLDSPNYPHRFYRAVPQP